MSYAVFDDGSKVVVHFWNLSGAEANGFGIVDGRMKRLDVLGGFVNYEVA